MKIIRFGPSGKMVCIGEDANRAAWYVISDKVRNFIGKYKEGDEVEFRSEPSRDGRWRSTSHAGW